MSRKYLTSIQRTLLYCLKALSQLNLTLGKKWVKISSYFIDSNIVFFTSDTDVAYKNMLI